MNKIRKSVLKAFGNSSGLFENYVLDNYWDD